MQKRIMGVLRLVLLGTCVVLPLAAEQKPPVFVFGGKQLYIGMSQHEAAAILSACCKLSPPVESQVEELAAPEGGVFGHFILPKEESPQGFLGAVYFSGGKMVRITRPLAEEVDTWDDDVVEFARAIKRFLAAEASVHERTVLVSVRQERVSNAESDVVSLSFPNGRGIELRIATLDKPDTHTNKRDSVTLDEMLGPAR